MCVKLILSWTFRKTAVTSLIIYKGTLHMGGVRRGKEKKKKRENRKRHGPYRTMVRNRCHFSLPLCLLRFYYVECVTFVGSH